MAHDEQPVEGDLPRPNLSGFARGTSAVDVARRVLVRVEAGAYATLALSGELERTRLAEPGRSLCTELVYGSLRRQVRLDRSLAALAPRGLDNLDPQVRALLRLGAYQLLFMRIPPPVAVSQVVQAITQLRGPGLGGFANALLRRLAREGEAPLPALPAPQTKDSLFVDALAARHGLARFLVADILAQLGREGAADLCAALETAAPVWLRLNPLRGDRDQALAALASEGIEVEPGPQALTLPEAVRITSGHPFGGTAYGEGWFTAQDLGAQLVARLLLADTEQGPLALPPGALLDACTGVGGKATHLSALTQNQRELHAVDASSRKLELCRDHAHRLGCQRISTVEVDLLDREALAGRLRPSYAAILLDAPCSGVGVLRRHPEARRRLNRPMIQELAAIQRQILANLASHVAPGGVLVYAVCSFLAAEGSEQAAELLRNRPDFRLLPPRGSVWQGLTDGQTGALHTFPHLHAADGFYAVRFQRSL